MIDCIIAYNTYLEIVSYDINSAFRGIFILIRKHIWKHFHVDVNLRGSSDYQQNKYYDSLQLWVKHFTSFADFCNYKRTRRLW